MTAIVGILNRNGAALAADSAATHTLSADNKKKITNHANKVFELSKYHPVGVAICANLAFMGLPWEDIFKLYRANLEKGSFAHLEDYVQNFMLFVSSSILPNFTNEQEGHLKLLLSNLKNDLIKIASDILIEQGVDEKAITNEQLFPVICDKLREYSVYYSTDKMTERTHLGDYSLESLKAYAQQSIDSILSDLCADEHCPEDFKSMFTNTFYRTLLSKDHLYLSKTEIVFWGYGEDDLFPQCHSILVSAAIDGKVKWTDNCILSVSNAPNSSAWIIPFAQTDVSNTVVCGVDQTLRDEFSRKAKEVLDKFKSDLTTKLEEVGAPEDFKNALDAFDIKPYAELFTTDMNNYIDENYIGKLMNTVSYLMKEDLADMAESLVRMTCLKRHFTTDDETVGGPVDVAVVTKGDGFVWIKRKHYFSADINHHYFER